MLHAIIIQYRTVRRNGLEKIPIYCNSRRGNQAMDHSAATTTAATTLNVHTAVVVQCYFFPAVVAESVNRDRGASKSDACCRRRSNGRLAPIQWRELSVAKAIGSFAGRDVRDTMARGSPVIRVQKRLRRYLELESDACAKARETVAFRKRKMMHRLPRETRHVLDSNSHHYVLVTAVTKEHAGRAYGLVVSIEGRPYPLHLAVELEIERVAWIHLLDAARSRNEMILVAKETTIDERVRTHRTRLPDPLTRLLPLTLQVARVI